MKGCGSQQGVEVIVDGGCRYCRRTRHLHLVFRSREDGGWLSTEGCDCRRTRPPSRTARDGGAVVECQQRVVVVRELAPQSRISSDERDMRWINGIVVVNGR